MKTRKSQPKNNKYYIRQANGGLNGAVKGYPTISGANVLCNCVGYANGRFNEIINDPDLKGISKTFKYQLVCNAENFIESAKKQGLSISSKPITGGIMVWQKGKTLGGGDGAGHVAVVEEVYSDGTILTSESGYGAWAFKTIRRSNSNGRWGQSSAYKFRGCIINPAVKDAKVVPVPKLSVDGVGGANTVRAMQKFLGTPADGVISGQHSAQKKFYPSLKAVKYGGGGSTCIKYLQKWLGVKQDGYINQATVKAWQKKIGAKVDGIFGKNSMKAWQKYLNANNKAVYPQVKPSTTKPSTTKGAKIASMAKAYAWAYGTASKKWKYKTGSARSAYKTALKKYMGKSARISRSDCGYFVSTCVRASGVSKSFLALKGTKAKFPSVPSTMKIVWKGKKIPSGVLQAGDIIRYKKQSGQHTMMYMGNGRIAEGQRGHGFPAIKKDTKKYNKSNVRKSTIQVLRAR